VNERVSKLREESVEKAPSISPERAELITEFYLRNEGKYSFPVLRALSHQYLCEKKAIYIGRHELIVGERGPAPKEVPTYPELTCHSLEDLKILNSRPKTNYGVSEETLRVYREKIIPYWKGRSMRDRVFEEMTPEWKACYDGGLFTEFMEQRAPGHTVADDKIYHKGFSDFKKEIAESMARLDFKRDPNAYSKRENLKAMEISCDAIILFSRRHADLAVQMAGKEKDPIRKIELEKIADVCTWIPANAPRDFWEALQMYWFVHLGVITELNGWDSFNPGHLDQHLYPFYMKGLAEGTLSRDDAKELLECFWIKFNNHPAPPKVGVTAAESGTYSDFTNINLGGLKPDGSDATNELSYLLLEVIDELHLIQPGNNVQISRKTPDHFLKAACRVIRKGYGFPAVFNADSVVEELVRQGKTYEDARRGGTSGCVEAGAFGKEAFILTGYLNLVKVLEITLHNGVDPRTGWRIGPETGDPCGFDSFDQLFEAYKQQLHHICEIKIKGNQIFERMYATYAPAPFLSVIIDDCIKNGKDYNDGGPRYNTNYIQGVGIGTLTDCLSALHDFIFDRKTMTMREMLDALAADFEGYEPTRHRLINQLHRYGNDDDYADRLMARMFNLFFSEVEGRPNTKGGQYAINMLPTTSHIYFGSVTGATPDGRKALQPVSEGISPVHGSDRNGPTAVIKSAGKMDHVRTGGTLLNLKFIPRILEGEEGIEKVAYLIRSYFKLDGHHVQFNVVNEETLRDAQKHPDQHRDLIVRVAGYSDYFCDLGKELQEEIISRTAHEQR
jgi:pyruvate formate-lyase/glycerol dehydratase family glycyl radical enzyme